MFSFRKCIISFCIYLLIHLYDNKSDKIYVARDPYGVRPLFKYKLDSSINICGFGSELKQLHCLKNNYQAGEIEQFTPATYAIYNNTNNGYQKIRVV